MALKSIYIPLQVVLERQNAAKRMLLTGTYLLTLYLNFFLIIPDWWKSSFFHEYTLMDFIEN